MSSTELIFTYAMLPYVTQICDIDNSQSMDDKFNAGAREARLSKI